MLKKSLVTLHAAAVSVYAFACPLGDVRIGFALVLGAVGRERGDVRVEAEDMAGFRREKTADGENLVWKGHPAVGPDFTVVATLKPERDGWSYSFSTSGNATELGLAEIRFPIVTVPRSPGAAVLHPQAVGMVRRPDWAGCAGGAEVASSRCGAFHFAAILNGTDDSWYVDQRGDAYRHPTSVKVVKGKTGDSATIAFSCVPEYAKDAALPFGGVIRRFRGDWYAAASIYREWVRGEKRVADLSARDRSVLREVAIWFWNRGPERDVAVPVEKWLAETGLRPALDWYWWHAIPYDVGYPHFWPPREGEAAFTAAVRRLSGKGIVVQPYVNGVAWDVDDPSWKKASAEVCTFRDGTFPATKYNNFTENRLTVMCGSSRTFHGEIRALARKLHAAGVASLYLDQIGGCADNACYGRSHPHPLGGGTAMKDGYRDMFLDVRRDNPGLLIASEDPAEAYMDRVDSFICLWQTPERFNVPGEPEARTVPVFQMLYHDLITVFGSYAVMDGIPPWDPKWPDDGRWRDERKWAELYPDQFPLEFARGVAMGMQPMVHQLRESQFTDPACAANFRFTVETARFYRDNRDWLFDGTMLDPGRMTCETQPARLFIRGIYTKPHEAREVTTCPPAVLHNVWRAPDGRIAAILCNWTGRLRKYRLETPEVRSEGEIPARTWRKVEISN